MYGNEAPTVRHLYLKMIPNASCAHLGTSLKQVINIVMILPDNRRLNLLEYFFLLYLMNVKINV